MLYIESQLLCREHLFASSPLKMFWGLVVSSAPLPSRLAHVLKWRDEEPRTVNQSKTSSWALVERRVNLKAPVMSAMVMCLTQILQTCWDVAILLGLCGFVQPATGFRNLWKTHALWVKSFPLVNMTNQLQTHVNVSCHSERWVN